MKSMIINEVCFGVLKYADSVAVDESDPLAILIAEEEGEAPSGYGPRAQFLEVA